MQKSILIIGAKYIDINAKVDEIASNYLESEVCFINYFGKNLISEPYLFGNCTEKTKLLVINELHTFSQIKYFYDFVSKPFERRKKAEKSIMINPRFIFLFKTELEAKLLFDFDDSLINELILIETKYWSK